MTLVTLQHLRITLTGQVCSWSKDSTSIIVKSDARTPDYDTQVLQSKDEHKAFLA